MRTALALCMVIISFVVAAPGAAQDRPTSRDALVAADVSVVDGPSLLIFSGGSASALEVADSAAGDTARATLSYAIVFAVAAAGLGVIITRPHTRPVKVMTA